MSQCARDEAMSSSIPRLKEFLFPALKVYVEAERPLKAREAARWVADALGLSEEARSVTLPSGKHLVYRHRTAWATNGLKHAGLVHSPSPAYWTATDAGRAYYAEHRDGLSETELAALRRRIREVANSAGGDSGSSSEQPVSPAGDERSPEEQIEAAIYELRQSVAADLLDRLQNADPDFFEQVVLDVLHAMGYGASESALRPLGGVGDGGIDGIISLDRLGLEKVYVQAKRWQGSVGRPEIQAFVGALSGRRATKGVFITTSKFTADAKEYAASVSDSLVLLSGSELAHLMIDYGVGVEKKAAYVIPEIDADYFVDE